MVVLVIVASCGLLTPRPRSCGMLVNMKPYFYLLERGVPPVEAYQATAEAILRNTEVRARPGRAAMPRRWLGRLCADRTARLPALGAAARGSRGLPHDSAGAGRAVLPCFRAAA
jgi:hypothetical protein